MLDFPENEEDSRNLKNVQELIQHFSEKFRYYVPNQNVTFKNEEQNFQKKTLITWPFKLKAPVIGNKSDLDGDI